MQSATELVVGMEWEYGGTKGERSVSYLFHGPTCFSGRLGWRLGEFLLELRAETKE